MNYDYIRLENQIKALMNRNYVSSSSHSQRAEEIVDGACNLYVDTVQKYFTFKYAGINDPVYIDPINKRLLNVKFINDVDISKLLSAIESGYGFSIEDLGEGKYKISVNEDMFALKTDVEAIENKFDNYTTTEDLEANYATKSEMTSLWREIDERPTYVEVANEYAKIGTVDALSKRLSDDYTTTEDLITNYATKFDLAKTDEKFDNYTTITDLVENYATKSDLNAVNDKVDTLPTTDDIEANYELKTELQAVDDKFDDYYTKTQADDKYTLKAPNITVLEERNFEQNTINNLWGFQGRYGEHFVIRGYYNQGTSFEINQVISDNTPIKINDVTNQYFIIEKASENQLYINNTINYITYCAVYVEKADEYVLDSTLSTNYYTSDECDAKFLEKSDNGTLTLTPTSANALNINANYNSSSYMSTIASMYKSNMSTGDMLMMYLGKSYNSSSSMFIGYEEPGYGTLGVLGYQPSIKFNNSSINLSSATTINGTLTCNSSTINGNTNINGSLTITTTTAATQFNHIAHILAPNITDNQVVTLQIGKVRDTNKAIIISYKEPGIGMLSLYNSSDSITFTSTAVTLNKQTTINGNLTVTGKVTSNGSNTINHYAPIEADVDASLLKVGVPVFASGNVYKRVELQPSDDKDAHIEYTWIPSTVDDRSDCICSVVLNGSYKEFVGIITSVDMPNGCVTFASHGDALYYCDNANIYEIGDVVLYDGSILDDDTPITNRIQQSIVGKVTAKIDLHTIALFMK